LELDEIQRLIDVPQLIREIETGFVLYSEGKVTVPPVGFLHFEDPPGDVHIKYGFVSGDEYYVLKMASGFYANAALGLPVADGLLLVFSQKTGELKLILLDKCWLTDMRTAAAGAVAAKHLAAQTVGDIGIVGTGVQARMQLEMLRDVVDCKSCLVWGRDPAKVESMIEDLRAKDSVRAWGLQIEPAESLDHLVSRCNLIVTTTSARGPLIRADQVQKGTHITAMGSDDHGKQELEAEVLAKADLVVADSLSQCVDHGECFAAVQGGHIEKDSILELGDVIKTPALGRTSEDQITVADLTGVAIQDIQIAKMVDRVLREDQTR
ncbi:MAG: ornithine cyclodeaminase family protein, partial [Gemmatimonadota bacterium]|nr:ornithine cyclodeaminase family protein [Gemmatimonadota bacterium]